MQFSSGAAVSAAAGTINPVIDPDGALGEAGAAAVAAGDGMFSPRFRSGPVVGALTMLSACVAPKPAEVPIKRPPPPAPTYSILGLEHVMGQTAQTLQSQFGKPELDVREADARKLQFVSAICVLDAYLYPPSRGAEPVVTWVDARMPDGRDFDRASCVAALSQQRAGN